MYTVCLHPRPSLIPIYICTHFGIYITRVKGKGNKDIYTRICQTWSRYSIIGVDKVNFHHWFALDLIHDTFIMQ